MADLNIRGVAAELLREVKAEAALEGLSLKDYVVKILSGREKSHGGSEEGQPARADRIESPDSVAAEVVGEAGGVDGGDREAGCGDIGVGVKPCVRCRESESVVAWGNGWRCKSCKVNFY